MVHQLDSSAIREDRERDVLDPVVPLVACAASELNDSAFADVDPVVVVQAAADPEMIPRLERGGVDLSHQVLQRGTKGGGRGGRRMRPKACTRYMGSPRVAEGRSVGGTIAFANPGECAV